MAVPPDPLPDAVQRPSAAAPTVSTPRFGRLLLICLLAILFCAWLVWFAMTYLPDCCGP
jgi:hypothetical protein